MVFYISINPLMPGGNKKVTYLNKPAACMCDLFYYHQALKG